MEAVCYFCLCSIVQYRNKKAQNASKSFEFLTDIVKLLK